MNVLLLFVSALLLLATLLPLSRAKVWWVRVLDFPRLQIAALLVATLALLWVFPLGLATLDAGNKLVLLGCLAWQCWWIAPYFPLAPREVPAALNASRSDRLRLLTGNVLMSKRGADRLIALIRRHEPDVFVTLETDQWWQARLDALGERYPHALKCPLDNRYGMHMYSTLPIVHAETRYLIEPDVPSMHMRLRLGSGRELEMHFLHPAPPSPTENDTSRKRDAELVTVGRAVAESTLPVIVAGDLNDVAWSRTTRYFKRISGLRDPRRGRGMFNSFHASYPFLRFPLDHVFHSTDFSLVAMQRLPHIGSDHFPILVELQLDDVPP